MAQSVWVLGPNGLVKELSDEESAYRLSEAFLQLIHFHADLVPPDTEVLTHTEDTLFKVYSVLLKTGYFSDQEVVEVVSEMQNLGILFRERVQD